MWFFSRKKRKQSLSAPEKTSAPVNKDITESVTTKTKKQNTPINTDHILQYKTYKNIIPQGKPRIYFCCHKDDFESYFESITDELLDIQQNAAIWYRDPKLPFPDDPQFLEDLELMQMFVIPVTSKFIKEDDPSRTVELKFADEKHIPVLFLMQEADLASDFNQICKDRQFLDKTALETDPTALPYRERLQKFLKEVLIGDELAQKIREAFAAYIFLSYRKKDRSEAQRIMRMIHENPYLRDVAIWYDEFLTPGENFNNEIRRAIEKSSLFALVVTPNLLQNPNFVMTDEYPWAREMNKNIVPVEAVPTDRKELSALYRNIADYKPSGDEKKIHERMHRLLVDVATAKTQNDPAHNYLIGLAYLSGIDVEKNTERAVEMIQGAANDGLPEAYEKLVRMYTYGDGVKEDEHEAYKWQKAYVKHLTDSSNEYSEELCAKICEEYTRQAVFLIGDKDYRSAEWCYDRVYDYAMILEKNNAKSAKYWMAMAFEKIAMAKVEGAKWNRRLTPQVLDQGRILLEEVVKYNEQIVRETPTNEARANLASAYCLLGDLCFDEVKIEKSDQAQIEKKEEALGLYQKAQKTHEELVKADDSPRMRRILMLDYERLAGAAFSLKNKEEARNMQEKYLEIVESICKETGSVQSYDDYAYGCRSMVAYAKDALEEELYLKLYLKVYQDLNSRTDSSKYTLNIFWAERALEGIKRKQLQELEGSILRDILSNL